MQLRRRHGQLHSFIPRPHSHQPISVAQAREQRRNQQRAAGLSLVPMTPPTLAHTHTLSLLTGVRGDPRGRSAVQGADVDAQGRRGGDGDPGDHNIRPAEGEDKDVLPAYETANGPPKYLEMEYMSGGPQTTPVYTLNGEQPGVAEHTGHEESDIADASIADAAADATPTANEILSTSTPPSAQSTPPELDETPSQSSQPNDTTHPHDPHHDNVRPLIHTQPLILDTD